MWSIVNERVSVRQDPTRYQALIWSLGRTISTILKGDRRWRTEEVGEEVERLMGTPPPLYR